MTDYSELKRLTVAISEGSKLQGMDAEEAMHAFECAATPNVVLGLIDHNEQLIAHLCMCKECGGEGEIHTGRWSNEGYNQPPEPIMAKCGECDGDGVIGDVNDLTNLLAENAHLKKREIEVRTETERQAAQFKEWQASHHANHVIVSEERDQLKAECEGLRGLFLSAAHGLCLPVEADAQQVVDAITALQVRNADLRKHAPSSEIIWCACGDGYPANSYGAGFMAANDGVCENCDAANTCGSEQP